MPPRNPNLGSRKRAADAVQSQKDSLFLTAAGDLLPPPQSDNVVEDDKVKQYLKRLKTDKGSDESQCIRIVMCDSETLYFDTQVQESLAQEFEVSLVSISEKRGLSIDRIASIYGPMRESVRCALFLAFVLNSRINNVVKSVPYTLKLTNYNIDVLIEASAGKLDQTLVKVAKLNCIVDWTQFQRNRKLYIVSLRGDFVSLFNGLTLLVASHPFETYSSDESVDLLPSVRVHDADVLQRSTNEEQKLFGGNKERILNYMFHSGSSKA